MRHQQVLKYIEKISRTGKPSQRRIAAQHHPSALNRRILGVERELGIEIFGCHPSGLRPNTVGEILLEHIRGQLADMDRVKSRIADLMGMRAGHINIATTRELVAFFLPALIKSHLAEFPAISFGVNLYERSEAENALLDHSDDIAIVCQPIHTRPQLSGQHLLIYPLKLFYQPKRHFKLNRVYYPRTIDTANRRIRTHIQYVTLKTEIVIF